MGFQNRYLITEEETTSIGSSPSTPKTNGPADAMSFVQNEVQKTEMPSSTNTNTEETHPLNGPKAQSQKELQPKGLMDNLQTLKNEKEIGRKGSAPTDNDITQKQSALDNFRRRIGG